MKSRSTLRIDTKDTELNKERNFNRKNRESVKINRKCIWTEQRGFCYRQCCIWQTKLIKHTTKISTIFCSHQWALTAVSASPWTNEPTPNTLQTMLCENMYFLRKPLVVQTHLHVRSVLIRFHLQIVSMSSTKQLSRAPMLNWYLQIKMSMVEYVRQTRWTHHYIIYQLRTPRFEFLWAAQKKRFRREAVWFLSSEYIITSTLNSDTVILNNISQFWHMRGACNNFFGESIRKWLNRV